MATLDLETTTKDYSLILYNKTEIDEKNTTESTRVDSELALKSLKADEGTPSGIATLSAVGKLVSTQLPVATNTQSIDSDNNSTVVTPKTLDYVLSSKDYIDASTADSSFGNLKSDGSVEMNAEYLPSDTHDIATVKYVQDTASSNTTTYVVDTLIQMYALDPVIVGDVCFVTAEAIQDDNGEFLCDTAATGGTTIDNWTERIDTAAWGVITGSISSQTDLQAALDAKADDTEITTINTKLDNISVTQSVDLDAIEAATLTNASDIAALESLSNVAISIVTTTPMGAQTLVAGTPEKLEWMTTALVDSGGSDISYDIPTNNILIGTTGVYKVYGVISAIAPINDIVDIELYIDNLPTGFESSCIGRGDSSKVTFVYSFMTSFSINDDINLYVTSSGTELTVQSASVTVEKTNY